MEGQIRANTTCSGTYQKMGDGGLKICQQCRNAEETVDHILVQCPFAKSIMEWIFSWCNIPLVSLNSMVDVLDYASNWGNCPKRRVRVVGICYKMMWSVWKARNNWRFNKNKMAATKVADIIKSITFVWFKHKSGNESLKWTDWSIQPL